jgi:hypothetical protein
LVKPYFYGFDFEIMSFANNLPSLLDFKMFYKDNIANVFVLLQLAPSNILHEYLFGREVTEISFWMEANILKRARNL